MSGRRSSISSVTSVDLRVSSDPKFFPGFISAVQDYDIHIFTVVHPSLHGFIT